MWNVDVVMTSNDGSETASVRYVRGGDTLSAIMAVTQSMRQCEDAPYYFVQSITISPAPADQTPNAVAVSPNT